MRPSQPLDRWIHCIQRDETPFIFDATTRFICRSVSLEVALFPSGGAMSCDSLGRKPWSLPTSLDAEGISDGSRRSRSAPTEKGQVPAQFDPEGGRRPVAGTFCDRLRGRFLIRALAIRGCALATHGYRL
jgi:hypothetical protein